ncbi:hypothetical protein EXIGLDRAFT_737112 [Exidia glandulosa HHB12029]|uniref:C3H1-type domain-containing protein n=1 Tax=Exidia glandulosa HHB12029 TaxID=1314781 RepID=A0A165J5K1_EXIGL|nr:hypothetical protein EXIGLDRAFT_737112 [Exidia glandulosa HHB12029]
MPTNTNGADDSFETVDDRNGERGGKSGRGQSKVKDLSHVPCKFFKVDACTAGASCPFSHSLVEPGRPKDVCTWFVKGNCKFGHKCALAHLLPGQPMSMDRKNKKAAQQAAGGGGGGGGGNGKGGERSNRRGGRNRSRERGGGERSSAAPPGLSRPPLTISKALGPSTAAPPVQDTDFAFDLPHDEAFVEVTPARPAQSADAPQPPPQPPSVPPGLAPPGLTHPSKAPATTTTAPSPGPATPSDTPVRPPPLPLSTPSSGRRGGDYGFGPIGSPPRNSPGRTNGFSPGTSPTYESNNGFPSSLSVPKASLLRLDQSLRTSPGATAWGAPAVAVDDEDLEEALPSSLNELLTDSERERRWSRTGASRPTVESLHHRYSRSVPATTWMDAVVPGAGSPGSMPKWTDVGGDIMPGTSLGASSGMMGMSLSPSNASGAFLGRPGLRALSAANPGAGTGTMTTSHSFDGTGAAFEDDRDTLGAMAMASPGARALASFAPGQSLPQGLAAGASRIHMMGMPTFASPPNSAGATGMFNTGRSVSGGAGAPPSMQQRRSDKWVMSSPLAGPVITNNDPDDGLFVMD